MEKFFDCSECKYYDGDNTVGELCTCPNLVGDEFALPIEDVCKEVCTEWVDKRKPKLTWEDIQAIDNIIVDLAQHTDWPLRGQEVFYKEVLRRFNENK
jgi:hypothetical protein